MRRVVVRAVEPLSSNVKNIRLACLDGQPLVYLPGQWINVRVALGDALEKRAYSIASAPDAAHPDEFELAVTRVTAGKVSLSLHALTDGQPLEIDGPYGFFTRQNVEHKPALFVATGTGVGPLRAMLQAELRQPSGPELTLLFGCRGEADILYRAQFEALAREHARFTFLPTLSRPDANWLGLRGYVQAQLPALVPQKQRPDVYVCGLSDMVDDVRKTLKSVLGYERTKIHSERYDQR
jgi:CDP-4-dehydro-6-deoxyglucose reductase, E3